MTQFDEKPDVALRRSPELAVTDVPCPASKLRAGAKRRKPKGRADCALVPQAKSDAVGRPEVAANSGQRTSAAASLAEIRAWHRRRCFAMEQRKRVDLALGSFLRTQLGWRRDLPDDESARIKKLAAELIACGEKVAAGKSVEVPEEFNEWATIILASLASRRPWDDVEDDACEAMERLASELPVWRSFGEPIRGFGARSLATIIGEAGDLSAYDDHSKLWKRMGLAVFDGVRQGGLLKSASKDDWIVHGYNRQRRSRMWNIGDALIKGNGDGRYRTAYLERKQYERDRAVSNGLIVAPAAKIPAKRKDEYMSDGHIHRRAQRYMEKRLLRDLWKAWRANFSAPETAFAMLPANSFTNERRANNAVPEVAKNSLPNAHLEPAE